MSFYVISRHKSFSEALKTAQSYGRFDTYTQHVDGAWSVVRSPTIMTAENYEEEQERAALQLACDYNPFDDEPYFSDADW
jgi:hypothetical protein